MKDHNKLFSATESANARHFSAGDRTRKFESFYSPLFFWMVFNPCATISPSALK
ncbi:Hypothetical predicted protein, partial [Olea europaea subsp. europaea]